MDKIFLILKGMAMGMAEVIPGVSGGTIAFITGIYERLLNAIKSFGPSGLKSFKEEGVAGFWKAIDGNFLIFLVLGMGAGIVVGTKGITHLLETYPEVLWAFFFGLIIASAIYIGRQVAKWSPKEIVAVVLGTLIAFGITLISPSEGNDALWFIFISGAIAISALILPGISGSFILLLMGMYTIVISAVKNFIETFSTEYLLTIIVFGLGCLTGLLTFSRVLSWTFKNYRNTTLALLTGFMIGSLNKIWPWRQVTQCLNKETGEFVGSCARNSEEFKILSEANVSPFNYAEITGQEPMFVAAIVAGIAGFGIVFLLAALDKSED